MTIELIELATMTATFSETFVLEGTPAGGRYIFEVGTLAVEGERVRATLKGRAAADWLVVGPDGTGTLDVRALLETGDDRYRWLNKVQAVAKGDFDGTTLVYELYELR